MHKIVHSLHSRGYGSENTTESLADDEDDACKGSTDDLKGEQTGAGVNISVSRLSESGEKRRELKYDQAKRKGKVKFSQGVPPAVELTGDFVVFMKSLHLDGDLS
jgi:hypothetical protein